METVVEVTPRRVIGQLNPFIYGQFIEHFHRQIYGGIFDPSSPHSASDGFRSDVMEAVKELHPSIIRWPGGCFASAYHWIDGVGSERRPTFDKAWRVEESNAFGTDEFVRFCNEVGAEPYICTNAGTGTLEEMSSWVEYCNLTDQGGWAQLRHKNGSPLPHNVRYWSIGNENYGDWEIGAKSPAEWGQTVREAAKMMKAVDPGIEISAASVPDIVWNEHLLREAGHHLDWLSIHAYWDPLWEHNDVSSFDTCMGYTIGISDAISRIEHILGAYDLLGKVKIAVDEWNLRGWHHPHRTSATEDYLSPRDLNDLNATYTMADALFTASFLDECIRHCRTVKMANFAPMVNCRGLIYADDRGIVLRTAYHVFKLYSTVMTGTVVDSWVAENPRFDVSSAKAAVPVLGTSATKSMSTGSVSIALSNRHPDLPLVVNVRVKDGPPRGTLHRIGAPSCDSYNDVEHPNTVAPSTEVVVPRGKDEWNIEIEPHSVNVLVLEG